MEITFTKTDRRKYDVTVRRDDGLTLRVPSPDRPAALPHDLAHCLVEQGLKLARGFWGCVADGAVFSGMQVISGRRRPRAAEHSKAVIKAAGQQLTVAEIYVSVMLAVAHEEMERDWPRVCARLDEAWRPFRGQRKPVSAAEVLRVCDALRAAERQWLALPVGQSIAVSWAAPQTSSQQRPQKAASHSSKAHTRR